MKFFHRPVTAFEDATLNFEQLEARSILDLTPTNVLQLAVAAKRKIAFGTGTFTGNGTASVTFNLAHGLAAVPGTAGGWLIGANGYLVHGSAADNTNIHFIAEAGSGLTFTNLTVFSFYWLAIG